MKIKIVSAPHIDKLLIKAENAHFKIIDRYPEIRKPSVIALDNHWLHIRGHIPALFGRGALHAAKHIWEHFNGPTVEIK